MSNDLTVSVVMPVYNEEKYIDKCIQSLLKQDFPKDDMEWIFIDGDSSDETVKIIKSYANLYPKLISVLTNPNRIVPCAMNIGIASAKGEYVIRLDAHAEYSNEYISKCVHYQDTTDADNVGGVAETKANGFVGRCISKVLSSKFGVGNSAFRTNGKSGYVDTVPFGAFRRNVFAKIGGFDERLIRNQDNEMNYRIRKNGGKIYLADDLHFAYFCRDSVKGISDMARKNGMWNVITMKLCPGSMGLRHFVPFMFVFSIIGLAVLSLFTPFFKCVLFLELVLYLVFDIFFSVLVADKIEDFCLITLLFPVFHVSYGFGSLLGLIKLFSAKYKKGAYEARKI